MGQLNRLIAVCEINIWPIVAHGATASNLVVAPHFFMEPHIETYLGIGFTVGSLDRVLNIKQVEQPGSNVWRI